MPSLTEHGLLGPPPVLSDDDCKDLDTIKAVLQDHAFMNGYAINVDCSTAIKAAWVCFPGRSVRNVAEALFYSSNPTTTGLILRSEDWS
jgi:hypothetical protein